MKVEPLLETDAKAVLPELLRPMLGSDVKELILHP